MQCSVILISHFIRQDLENGETEAVQPPQPAAPRRSHEKAVLARVWGNFDRK